MLLGNIIHNGELETSEITEKLKVQRKLPAVIPVVNATNEYSEGVAPAVATQFRDW